VGQGKWGFTQISKEVVLAEAPSKRKGKRLMEGWRRARNEHRRQQHFLSSITADYSVVHAHCVRCTPGSTGIDGSNTSCHPSPQIILSSMLTAFAVRQAPSSKRVKLWFYLLARLSATRLRTSPMFSPGRSSSNTSLPRESIQARYGRLLYPKLFPSP